MTRIVVTFRSPRFEAPTAHNKKARPTLSGSPHSASSHSPFSISNASTVASASSIPPSRSIAS